MVILERVFRELEVENSDCTVQNGGMIQEGGESGG